MDLDGGSREGWQGERRWQQRANRKVAAKGQQEGEAGWKRLETVAHFPATVTDQADEVVKEE